MKKVIVIVIVCLVVIGLGGHKTIEIAGTIAHTGITIIHGGINGSQKALSIASKGMDKGEQIGEATKAKVKSTHEQIVERTQK